MAGPTGVPSWRQSSGGRSNLGQMSCCSCETFPHVIVQFHYEEPSSSATPAPAQTPHSVSASAAQWPDLSSRTKETGQQNTAPGVTVTLPPRLTRACVRVDIALCELEASRLGADPSCRGRAKGTARKELVAAGAESLRREKVYKWPAPAARGLPLQLNVRGVAGAQVKDVIAEHVEGGTVECFCEDVGDHVARGNEEWLDDVSGLQVLDEHHGPFEVARARCAAWFYYGVPSLLVVS
eukprot:scaffold29127_cov128-Isochrysis_galbana.AAC.1